VSSLKHFIAWPGKCIFPFESEGWWMAGILKNGRGDYADYIEEVYEISLEGNKDL